MSMHTFALIIVWFFGVILTAVLFLTVYIVGRNSIKDNPDKAYIFTLHGKRLSRPKRGNLIEENKDGFMFKYGKRITMIPRKYMEIFHRGRRAVFLAEKGAIIGSPLVNENRLTPSEREFLLYSLIDSYLTGNAIKEIKGKASKVSLTIIAVIAFFFGAIVTYGFISFQKAQAPTTSHTTTQTQPAPTTPTTTPDYKIQQGSGQ